MRIYGISLFLAFFLSGFTYAQEISGNSESVVQKIRELASQNKLNTIIAGIDFITPKFHYKDTSLTLYAYTDTILLKDGFYSIGQLTLDPHLEYDMVPVGAWKTYYPGGALFATGEYSMAAWIVCAASGPFVSSYPYRTGKWTFWYKDATKMGEGFFDRKEEMNEENNCGSQGILRTSVGNNIELYDETGKKITTGTAEIIRLIDWYTQHPVSFL